MARKRKKSKKSKRSKAKKARKSTAATRRTKAQAEATAVADVDPASPSEPDAPTETVALEPPDELETVAQLDSERPADEATTSTDSAEPDADAEPVDVDERTGTAPTAEAGQNASSEVDGGKSDSTAEPTISLDLDESYDRDQLIAEAIAFAEADESGVDPETLTDGASEEGDDEPTHVTSLTLPSDPGAAARPVISTDALEALAAMSRQGVTLPGELVLDLGEATTDDDRDRLLAAALAQVEMQDAVYRVAGNADRTSRRWKGVLASMLIVVAMAVAVRPPGWIVPEPPAALTNADQLQGVRVTLLLQAQQIEVFQARQERLPESLAEVAVTFPGVRFVKSNNRVYQLVSYTPSGEAVLYDSATPPSWYDEVTAEWITTRTGS